MAKKGMLERENKRKILAAKYFKIRKDLLSKLKTVKSFTEKLELNEKIQMLKIESIYILLLTIRFFILRWV